MISQLFGDRPESRYVYNICKNEGAKYLVFTVSLTIRPAVWFSVAKRSKIESAGEV
jgi:hypothetical protein